MTVSLRSGAAHQRSNAGEHHRADHYRDGGFCDACGWLEDGCALHTLSHEVGSQWIADSAPLRIGAVPDLRQAVAADPKLRVIIAHGWNDLSCPFMGSVLTVDQMPLMGESPARIAVREYPGGHMFYSRPGSQAACAKMCRRW